jgi:small subunit ribosomal protein S9
MPNKINATKEKIQTVGRRKTAAARVRLYPGSGKITVNGRDYKDYFKVDIDQKKISSPLRVTGKAESLDISAKVVGGGVHGQAEAVRHAISRSLVKWDENLKPVLKAEGFLTRDPREKERKKFGRYKARRGHQWRKR